MFEICGWVGTSLILIGYYLNAKRLSISWIVWFVGNLMMLIYSMGINAWPQLVLAIVLMCLNIYGYINWKNNNK